MSASFASVGQSVPVWCRPFITFGLSIKGLLQQSEYFPGLPPRTAL